MVAFGVSFLNTTAFLLSLETSLDELEISTSTKGTAKPGQLVELVINTSHLLGLATDCMLFRTKKALGQVFLYKVEKSTKCLKISPGSCLSF